MSNKSEILYDLVFKSIIRILTQNYLYKINIKTITIVTELTLTNAIAINFPNSQRIGCLFHHKEDLLRECRILGILNQKNRNINPEITIEAITQLSILPLDYRGDIQ